MPTSNSTTAAVSNAYLQHLHSRNSSNIASTTEPSWARRKRRSQWVHQKVEDSTSTTLSPPRLQTPASNASLATYVSSSSSSRDTPRTSVQHLEDAWFPDAALVVHENHAVHEVSQSSESDDDDALAAVDALIAETSLRWRSATHQIVANTTTSKRTTLVRPVLQSQTSTGTTTNALVPTSAAPPTTYLHQPMPQPKIVIEPIDDIPMEQIEINHNNSSHLLHNDDLTVWSGWTQQQKGTLPGTPQRNMPVPTAPNSPIPAAHSTPKGHGRSSSNASALPPAKPSRTSTPLSHLQPRLHHARKVPPSIKTGMLLPPAPKSPRATAIPPAVHEEEEEESSRRHEKHPIVVTTNHSLQLSAANGVVRQALYTGTVQYDNDDTLIVTGTGTLQFVETGDTYTGQVVNGQMHGSGTYLFSKRRRKKKQPLQGIFEQNVFVQYDAEI